MPETLSRFLEDLSREEAFAVLEWLNNSELEAILNDLSDSIENSHVIDDDAIEGIVDDAVKILENRN
jgi:hypothetical protein